MNPCHNEDETLTPIGRAVGEHIRTALRLVMKYLLRRHNVAIREIAHLIHSETALLETELIIALKRCGRVEATLEEWEKPCPCCGAVMGCYCAESPHPENPLCPGNEEVKQS